MRALEFTTGHVIYNPAYTYKFQLKTTIIYLPLRFCNKVLFFAVDMFVFDFVSSTTRAKH